MKNKNIIMALSLMAFLSCESDPMQKFNNVKSQVKNTSTVVDNVANAEKTMKDAEDHMEVLVKITPFNSDGFKAWLPEEVAGMSRKSYEFMTIMGSQGTAKYSDEAGDKTLDFTINDGAGEQGAAMFMTQASLSGLYGNFESESDTKKESIVERNGIPSLETYYKQKNESSIRTTIKNRFIVSATGTHMNPDELYNLIEKLHIQNLK